MLMQAQKRVSKLVSLVAPTGGINDIDPFSNMEAKFCIDLVNIFPGNNELLTRRGFREHATNLGGPVKTLMPYTGMDGTRKLFAVTAAGIYDITLSTNAPALVYALPGSGYVSYVQFSNSGASFLIGCNGTQSPFYFDGTNWAAFSTASPPLPFPEPPPIYGVGEVWGGPTAGINTFKYVTSHLNRLWFVPDNSMDLYYLDTDSLGGELTLFPVGGVFHRGGEIFDMASWTYNSGNTIDDKLIVRTSSGEIAIYSGLDPTSIDTWHLEGYYFVASPVGVSDTYAQFGGDIIMITAAGIVPLSNVVSGIAEASLYEASLSKNISRTLNRLVHSHYFKNNWSIYNAPSLQAIVVVVPPAGDGRGVQFIMNVLTGAWTKYDLPANCGLTFNRQFYFGSNNGTVSIFNDADLDYVKLDGTGGSPINSLLWSAYNYFDDPTTLKHFKLIRPIMQSDNKIASIFTLVVDYDVEQQPGNPFSFESLFQTFLWDEALWDEALWTTVNYTYRPWMSAPGLGYCAGIQAKFLSRDVVRLVAMEFVYESGGAI